MTRLSQKRIEWAWVVTNLGYAVFRILLARQFLGHHGLNVWAFAVVEAVSSVPWAVGSARLVRAVAGRRLGPALRWAGVATVGFFAPDVFVLATTHHVPWYLYAVIGTWMAVATVLAARHVVSAIRERRAGGALRTPAASPPSRR